MIMIFIYILLIIIKVEKDIYFHHIYTRKIFYFCEKN